MRHLEIHNFGPLKNVDIELKRINVIIGPQSSGKSCVLKIACFCTWVEKRIEIEQSTKRFSENNGFESELVRFHKLDGYMHKDSSIKYESDLMRFSYSAKEKIFDFKWNEKNRWEYKRTKICYIPAERNMVAAIPNWFEVKLENNNILNFMKDWETARKAVGDFPVLNFDVKYHYDPAQKKDEVIIQGGKTLDFTNTSSGLQSVIPICGLLRYFFEVQFSKEAQKSVESDSEKERLLSHMFALIYNNKFAGKVLKEVRDKNGIDDQGRVDTNMLTFYPVGMINAAFINEHDAEECRRYYSNYTETDHCDIFLEEPELNLFPLAQRTLLNWIITKASETRRHTLFIATHSPYIMTSLNNLLEAGNAIAENEGKRGAVEKVIPKEKILSYKDVGAFAVENDEVCCIMDEEDNLISAEALDKASDVISEEFDKLMDLRWQR